MINQSYTAVVERAQGLRGVFATEPYEAAWAREAIVFLKVLELTPGGSVAARVQISPDGVDWVDEGTVFAPAIAPGLYFVKLTNFGGWLRLDCEVQDAEASADLFVYIALKE
jgi:hypothetical protein